MTLSIDQWRERGHFAELCGHRIFCVDTGELDKPTILFIHGFPTSSWDWVPLWGTLNDTHRLVTLDLLGFGYSAKPDPHRYSIHEQADICEALVEDRKLASQPSPERLDSFWALIHENDGKHVFHNLITYMSDRKQHRERWARALRESSVPIGLINGSADPVSGAHMVERYREVVSRDHYVAEFPDIGHYPQVEAPAETLDAYLRFLRQV